jgi:hypothetical protein
VGAIEPFDGSPFFEVRWKYYSQDRLVTVISNLYGPAPKVWLTFGESAEHHHTIRKSHGPRMRLRKIANLRTHGVRETLIRRTQVEIISWHYYSEPKEEAARSQYATKRRRVLIGSPFNVDSYN